jgi:GR25 family glycosyltransferase involved in LPS biosynthesis
VNHTIGIVAHTKRSEQAHQLMESTRAAYMSIDNGTLGCELNHRKVWLWHLEHCTTQWAVSLEDDAVPIPQFQEQVQAALEQSPSPVVSFYFGRHRIAVWEKRKQIAISKAEHDDANWFTGRTLLHAVAVAVRTDVLSEMITHATQQLPDTFPNDEAISHWANATGNTVAYTWPSLVDHADQPTLFVHPDKLPRPPGRKAYKLGIRTTWTDKAVTL